MLDVVVEGNSVLWVFPLVSPIGQIRMSRMNVKDDTRCCEDSGLEIPSTLRILCRCPPGGCIASVYPLF